MDAFTDPDVETIVWQKSAQVGATEVLNNALGYVIHRDPAPVLLVQPTEAMAKAWSSERLEPTIRDTPALRARVHTRRSKEGGSSVYRKSFRGGHITVAWANSASNLASRPIRVLLADEVDRYPASAGDEGDPLELARKRTTTFAARKVYVTSTPTIDGQSRIQREFEASDQRYYMVPCPHCGHEQRLRWANVQWETDAEGRPHDVRYLCSDVDPQTDEELGCGALIEEREKEGMVAAGRWQASAEGQPGVVGFHLSELYSPWSTWSSMAVAFLRSKREGKDQLKTWINTALGEVWKEAEVKIEAHAIEERAETYPAGTPPAGCLVLTAGVDVQDTWIECLVKGWGHEGEAWGVDWRHITGDPSRAEIWRQLDSYLLQTFARSDGVQLRIGATCIDSGFLADEVYRFTKPRLARRVFATKGVSGEGRPIIPARPTKVGKRRTLLYSVGVDTAKDLFFARLAQRTPGPGYQHYPQAFDGEFFEQITSEVRETHAAGRRWKKIRKRNEALDLEVLNLAAFSILRPNLRAIERNLASAEAPAPPPPPPINLTAAAADLRRRRRRR